MELKQTKIRKGTWKGQAGECWELLVKGAAGPRLAVHRWLEDGEQGKEGQGSVRVLTGSHNSGTLVCHLKIYVGDPMEGHGADCPVGYRSTFGIALAQAERKLAEVIS